MIFVTNLFLVVDLPEDGVEAGLGAGRVPRGRQRPRPLPERALDLLHVRPAAVSGVVQNARI